MTIKAERPVHLLLCGLPASVKSMFIQPFTKLATTLGNISTQISNGQDAAALALSNFGIPLTGSMSVGFAIGIIKG